MSLECRGAFESTIKLKRQESSIAFVEAFQVTPWSSTRTRYSLHFGTHSEHIKHANDSYHRKSLECAQVRRLRLGLNDQARKRLAKHHSSIPVRRDLAYHDLHITYTKPQVTRVLQGIKGGDKGQATTVQWLYCEVCCSEAKFEQMDRRIEWIRENRVISHRVTPTQIHETQAGLKRSSLC